MVPIGHGQLLGDLDQREAPDVEGHEGLAVQGLELVQRLPEPSGALAGDQLVERLVAVRGGAVEHLVLDARRRDPPGGAVDRHPDGHLPEPAGEPLGLAELVEPAHDVEEDLLRQLQRLARVAQPAQRDGVDRPLELLDQQPERLAVALAGADRPGPRCSTSGSDEAPILRHRGDHGRSSPSSGASPSARAAASHVLIWLAKRRRADGRRRRSTGRAPTGPRRPAPRGRPLRSGARRGSRAGAGGDAGGVRPGPDGRGRTRRLTARAREAPSASVPPAPPMGTGDGTRRGLRAGRPPARLSGASASCGPGRVRVRRRRGARVTGWRRSGRDNPLMRRSGVGVHPPVAVGRFAAFTAAGARSLRPAGRLAAARSAAAAQACDLDRPSLASYDDDAFDLGPDGDRRVRPGLRRARPAHAGPTGTAR